MTATMNLQAQRTVTQKVKDKLANVTVSDVAHGVLYVGSIAVFGGMTVYCGWAAVVLFGAGFWGWGLIMTGCTLFYGAFLTLMFTDPW